MDYSRKISERHWNLPDKGELESMREKTFIDDMQILCCTDGVRPVVFLIEACQ